MFGLTFEKLLLIAVLGAFLLGPDRLPEAARRLGELARGARRLLGDAQSRVKEEMGPEFDTVDWAKLDPRRYDPRQIIRDALREPPASAAENVRLPANRAAPRGEPGENGRPRDDPADDHHDE
jgi:sec-independent protein translocase protein TatB